MHGRRFLENVRWECTGSLLLLHTIGLAVAILVRPVHLLALALTGLAVSL
jgi:hypothetical protein